MKRPSSPLELLHPDGQALSWRLIGGNCPDSLRPAAAGASGPAQDLIIFAPKKSDCSRDPWLRCQVSQLASQLSEDGVAYLLAPPGCRSKLKNRLQEHGLIVEMEMLHYPDASTSSFLIPLHRAALDYALTELIQLSPWKRRLAALMLRFPRGKQLLGELLPHIGIVVRRPGKRPVFHWLFRMGSSTSISGPAVIRTSWRGKDGAALLYRFGEGETFPSAVAKVSNGAEPARNAQEYEFLSQLVRLDLNASAQLPQPLHFAQDGSRTVLLETFVRGEPLTSLLDSSPRRLFEVFERIASWLDGWNLSTRLIQPLTWERLERDILSPAAALAPFAGEGASYLDWLRERCSRLAGVPTPWVAAHNDLTMWNILLTPEGCLGILDWEAGQAQGFPLVDLFYTLVDAAAAADGYAERGRAFQACFSPGGIYQAEAAKQVRRLCTSLDIQADFAELCFHACWLHHAANELKSTAPPDSRPFLQIVQQLSGRELDFRKTLV